MKPLKVNKLAGACATALLAGGMLVHISPVLAATAAGTQIKNLATVTYEDENGNTYSAQSNEAVITVKQVYSAEVGVDEVKSAAAGQVVYIQHTLTNTGNGEDTYSVSALNDASVADTLNSSSVKLFLDSNGNGLADAGEKEVSSVTLAAGQSADLVIAVTVPNTATATDTLGVILNATSTKSTVTDITTNKGTDGLDNTTQTMITVGNDAVLNYTKSAVLDAANHQITYTLTISNTGNQAATDVQISDVLPKGTTPVGTPTAFGILASNTGDVLPSFTTNGGAISEATDGIDYNNDGDKLDTLDSYTLTATDKSIAPGQTISIKFVAAYNPYAFNNNAIAGSAGDTVKNVATLTADLNGDNNPDAPIQSNPTQTVLPQEYGVNTSDTGVADPDSDPSTINDGGDDTGTINDVQLVDSAPAGSSVLFTVTVTNNGTGRDTFELTTNNSSFPPGTVFTYWNESGTVQLVDTNSKGGVDTGMLEAGETTTLIVKAQLPTDATTGGTVTVTATSAKAPTVVADAATLQLQTVSAPGVDLYDDVKNAGTVDNEDDLGSTPYDINNGVNAGSRATLSGAIGGKVLVPLYIDNGSGSSDSFQFSIGSSWDGTTVGSLPNGWSALFYKADASGNPTGSPLTSTSLLPAMSTGASTSNQYVAVVTIPNNPAYALADYVADNDGTPASLEKMDSNNDGDGDQPVFIRIQSANSGSSDIMLDAIDVESVAQVQLTPPGNNQIQPGGSVDYNNTLENTGNTTETLELTATNSLAGDDWGNVVKVDTNGDGIPDKTLTELSPGDVIKGVDTDGNPVDIPVTDADGDDKPEVTLLPGYKFDLTPTVFAPTSAAPGETDVLTVVATNVNPATGVAYPANDPENPSANVEDVSNVILGQVRLDKKAALDANCDGIADNPASFAANLTAEVAPGECAVWQIQAENQGDALAKNVIIRDNVPAFTTYVTDSLRYCLNIGCTIDNTQASTDGASVGTVSGSDITFYVGANAVPGNTGGELQPGQQATVQFSTKVD